MARKKKTVRRKKARKPLKREDIHKHPVQGTTPYRGPAHHHHPTYGPFHYVPIVMDSHVAGRGGFTTSDPSLHGPFFGLGPRNYAKSDTRVLEDVCDLLTLHGELDVRDVDVHCRNGVIRLEGSVPTRWMRREIEAAADSVAGVVGIENNLELAD